MTFLMLNIGITQPRFLWGPLSPNMKKNWACSLRVVAFLI